MIITIFTSPFFSSAEQNFSSNREKSARAQRSQIQSVIIIIIIIIIITTVDVCAGLLSLLSLFLSALY